MLKQERDAISVGWQRIGDEVLRDANLLRNQGSYRSSVSRSYYAAYSYLASALVQEQSVTFKIDREGPEHDLSDMVAKHLHNYFSIKVLPDVRLGIKTLYEMRLVADYKPRASVRREIAIEALQLATTIANNVRRCGD